MPVDCVLRSRVESLLRSGVRRVLLDLSGVSNIDAADVGELIQIFNAAAAAGLICRTPSKSGTWFARLGSVPYNGASLTLLHRGDRMPRRFLALILVLFGALLRQSPPPPARSSSA
jgi:hypothetical protein